MRNKYARLLFRFISESQTKYVEDIKLTKMIELIGLV